VASSSQLVGHVYAAGKCSGVDTDPLVSDDFNLIAFEIYSWLLNEMNKLDCSIQSAV
jgi:hypothetical protein